LISREEGNKATPAAKQQDYEPKWFRVDWTTETKTTGMLVRARGKEASRVLAIQCE
jgi:hypothetical protein